MSVESEDRSFPSAAQEAPEADAAGSPPLTSPAEPSGASSPADIDARRDAFSGMLRGLFTRWGEALANAVGSEPNEKQIQLDAEINTALWIVVADGFDLFSGEQNKWLALAAATSTTALVYGLPTYRVYQKQAAKRLEKSQGKPGVMSIPDNGVEAVT